MVIQFLLLGNLWNCCVDMFHESSFIIFISCHTYRCPALASHPKALRYLFSFQVSNQGNGFSHKEGEM